MAKKFEQALKKSEAFFEIGGKRLLIKKWNLKQTMKYGGEVAMIAKKLYGQENIQELEVSELITSCMDNVLPIVSDTIFNEKNGFESIDEAEKWINEDLGLIGFVSLATFIVKQNFGGDKKKEIETLKALIPGLNKLFAKLSPMVSVMKQFLE